MTPDEQCRADMPRRHWHRAGLVSRAGLLSRVVTLGRAGSVSRVVLVSRAGSVSRVVLVS